MREFMDGMNNTEKQFSTVIFSIEKEIGYIKINRSESKNTINDILVDEITEILDLYENKLKVFVLMGNEQYFCNGSDFQELVNRNEEASINRQTEKKLFHLWKRIGQGPYIFLCYVEGIANAGGIGFIAACDIAIGNNNAVFSLSEMLFGLYPAMVLPFLINKVGFQNAKYLTLSTTKVNAKSAKELGLLDEYEENGHILLRKTLLRLSCLRKDAIGDCKKYLNSLSNTIDENVQSMAINENKKIFENETNVKLIHRYVNEGKLPWERD